MRRALFCRLLFAAGLALSILTAPAQGVAEDKPGKEFYRDFARGTPGHGVADVYGRAPAGGGGSVDAGATVLRVSGLIGAGAHVQFRAALVRARPDLVVLDGPGGVLGEALLIAEEVRRRGLTTMVGPNRSCASACAIVFLAGRTKFMGAGAAVGLHSASYADGRADPEATELMAAYLRQVGVPDATLRRMAMTAPSDIRWLTASEQQAMRIRPYTGR